MIDRSRVLDIGIDRSIGIRHKPRSITDAVSIDRIRHKVILRVTQRQPPEGVIRRKPACRKVHDVVVLAGESMTRAIYGCCPVRRFLRYVYGRKFIGARGLEQHVIARLAASENGGPAVDRRDIGSREDLECDERQPNADEDALHDIQDDSSPEHDGEHPFARIS